MRHVSVKSHRMVKSSLVGGGFMKPRTIAVTTALALIGWTVVALAKPDAGNARAPKLTGYQLAANDDANHRDKDEVWEWYQGQRGHWRKENNQWRWFGADNDEWYQGHPGHWYMERNGWHFATPDLICNNEGRNCRRGGYLPPNGEGMVSRRNPKWFWHCDSEGHHCNWARRPM
jgi:hypothetical protein